MKNGAWEKVLQEYQEALHLNHPPFFVHYSNLMAAYMLLNRFPEAKAIAQRAFAQNLDAPMIHERLLTLAYIEGDRESAAKEVQWFTGKPEEAQSFVMQARNAYSLGQRRKAKELYRRAKALPQRQNFASAIASTQFPDAVYDAVLGNCEAIRAVSEPASHPYQNRESTQPPALALALCGGVAQAQKIANKTSQQFPLDTLWNAVKQPAILAAVELRRNHPANAIQMLQAAAPYERTYPYVIYLRGLAYLEAKEAAQAGVEFQKILDHKGAYWITLVRGPYFPLSYLGLARASAMSGDTAKAKKAYQDFLTLWKDADPDLAPLIQARKEYSAFTAVGSGAGVWLARGRPEQ